MIGQSFTMILSGFVGGVIFSHMAHEWLPFGIDLSLEDILLLFGMIGITIVFMFVSGIILNLDGNKGVKDDTN